ncbi:MAG: hypothetical protein HS111_14510 [Kofleriaceae bacterium]|nr:hypothetical protein [Kofleriaceae bacterium]
MRKLEAAGRLHPVRGPDGRWWHDEREVAAMVQVHAPPARAGGAHVQPYTAASSPWTGAPMIDPAAWTDAPVMPPWTGAPVMDPAAWRAARIDQLLQELHRELVTAGWDHANAKAGLSAASAALSALPDAHLAGSLWPPWVARATMAWTLFGQELERPWVDAWCMDGFGAWVPTTRPVQPGD